MRRAVVFLLVLIGAAVAGCGPMTNDPASASYAFRQTQLAAGQAADYYDSVAATQMAETAVARDAATAQAQAVATQDARKSTEIAYQRTQEVIDLQLRQTAAADARKETESALALEEKAAASTQEAIDQELKNQRAASTNMVLAWAKWIALGLAVIASSAFLVLGMIKYWKKPIVIERDVRGDAPLLADHYGTIYDNDRNPYPAVRLLRAGPQIPQLTDPAMQMQTTTQDQLVDRETRGLPQPAGTPVLPRLPRQSAPRQLPAVTTVNQPRIVVYPPDQTPPKLLEDPRAGQALEGDWRAEGDKI